MDPGFVEKREMVWMAKAISGRVLSTAYMSDPTASWYGMSRIWANSAVVDGDWAVVSQMLVSMGMEMDLRS